MNSDGIARGILTGGALGIGIAAAFVALIRVVPEDVFLSTPAMIGIYAAQVPVGLVIAWLALKASGPLNASASAMMLGICAGVGLTDGILIGFWPEAYGQTGDAMLAVAAAVIWGVTCNAAGVHAALLRPAARAR
jgi:hypothetical protein